MALPTKGAWARQYAVPYSGAGVWGTGINPIHAAYGGPPVRMGQLHGREGEAVSAPSASVPQTLLPGYMWGYTLEDSHFTGVYYGDRPGWDVQPQDSPVRVATHGQPPASAPGSVNSAFRAMRNGAHRIFQDFFVNPPSETVSEGWLNKPKGSPADSKPSDPSQYEIQTAMAQRYAVRNNTHAVGRGTDPPRSEIQSRVTGQKVKEYSGGKRHYDMFPYQQTPETERPFWYRQAGTADPLYMVPNEQYTISAVERTPPPDPYIGPADTSGTFDFGYTSEDQFYA